jgi:hypothetical protein
MTLLLQVGAVIAAGFVIAAAGLRQTTPDATARAIVLLVLASGYLAFWSHVWPNSHTFMDQRSAWSTLTPAQAAMAGTAQAGIPPEAGPQGPFVEWIRGRLPRNGRYYIVPTTTQGAGYYQWYTYRLLPNLAAARPSDADWLIFYGTTPKASGYEHLVGEHLQFAPGYSIAKLRRAR